MSRLAESLAFIDSPIALIAFICLTFLGYMLAKKDFVLQDILRSLKDIPEKDREKLIARRLGEPIPPNMSAEKFIELKRESNKYRKFIGFLCFGITFLGLIILAFVSIW
jgi:hypothetical protein